MNVSITQGLDLMPPPFEDGLDVWSSEDGTPGSATYDGAGNAAIVPADADFSGCLELVKTQSIQTLRWMGQTPILPGVYLRIRARVKVISGAFPTVRVAAYAADASGSNLTSLVQIGDTVAFDSYGEIKEVTAIVGAGARSGVDMVWGTQASYGHFGLDLTGSSGGVVRIDDLVIEDVTEAFLPDMLGSVSVIDYGALGDGVTDDRAAFLAADLAADGRMVVVPPGTYFIGSSLSMNSEVNFEGTMTMATATVFSLTRQLNLNTYAAAFGDDATGFKKGFQALLYYSDHDAFDLSGRRIELTEPIDMMEIYGGGDNFLVRRVIRNGQLYALDDPGWDDGVVTRTGSYSTSNPLQITNITNAASIEVGALVTGNGVGREVYVKSVNAGAGSVELSQPLYGPAGTQSYTFTRFRYMLDFSPFANVRRMVFESIEFQMNGHCSAVMLSPVGENYVFNDCWFIKPKDRGITSIGRGCQDLHVDRCQFISNEQATPAQDRTSVGFNVNANDAKIRNNRFQRMGTSMVFGGGNHMVSGNHLFQGDNETAGTRVAGILITNADPNMMVTNNYVDNCSVEWTNEHDETPALGSEYSFGGVILNGNIFLMSATITSSRWIRIKPYGANHYIAGLHVTDNHFQCNGTDVDRVEEVDTTFADLDPWRCRDVTFDRNAFHGITQRTMSPATLRFTQATAATTWTLDVGAYLPFGGNARTITSVVLDDDVTNGSGAAVYATPRTQPNVGTNENMVALYWPEATKGTVHITTRVDRTY